MAVWSAAWPPHPKDEMVAAGYEDGMIILAPLDGRMEMLIHPPVAGRKVSSVLSGMAMAIAFSPLSKTAIFCYSRSIASKKRCRMFAFLTP